MGQLSSPPRGSEQDAALLSDAPAAPERAVADLAWEHELISVGTYGPLVVQRYRKPDGRRLTLYRHSPPAS